MSKTEFDKRKGQEVWIYCNDCQRNTLHNILSGIDYMDSEEIETGYSFDFWYGCDIVQCGGCKNIAFTKRSTNSESSEPGDEDIIQQFPPKKEKTQWYIKEDIYKLPPLLRNIYTESIEAISNNSMTLVGIGMRAILDTICRDKNVSGKNLEERIDNLVSKGFLTPDGAEILHGIRLIGNDAAHDAKAPKRGQINAAMKVIDHLILGIYIIPQEAYEELPKRIKNVASKTTNVTETD